MPQYSLDVLTVQGSNEHNVILNIFGAEHGDPPSHPPSSVTWCDSFILQETWSEIVLSSHVNGSQSRKQLVAEARLRLHPPAGMIMLYGVTT